MRQVMEQYASAIVSILMALFILAFFCGDGDSLNFVIARMFAGSGFEKSSIQSGKTFDQWMDVNYPEIYIKNPYVIKVNTFVSLEDVFFAVSGEETVLEVTLDACWDEQGVIQELSVDDGGNFRMQSPGIYWMRLSAVDFEGNTQAVFLKIFVNER